MDSVKIAGIYYSLRCNPFQKDADTTEGCLKGCYPRAISVSNVTLSFIFKLAEAFEKSRAFLMDKTCPKMGRGG